MKNIASTALALWTSFLVIAIGMGIFTVFIVKMKMDAAAEHISEMVASNGVYDTAEQQRVEAYLSRNHITAQISVTSSDDDVTSMTLGDSFTVRLTPAAGFIGAGGVGGISIPIAGQAEGLCGVYRK